MNQGKSRGRRAAAIIVVALSVAGCGRASDEGADASGPATVEPVAGSELSVVTLTPEAVQRIDLQTSATTSGAVGLEIPYAAVLYDTTGNTWAFVQTAELTYVRQPIAVDHIEGEVAYLTGGLAQGAEVVTTGAIELYGAELGIGEEE